MSETTGLNRRVVFAGGAALLLVPGPVGARMRVMRVLFICEFGTAKSAIAREMFRRRARERDIPAKAFSRGFTIQDHISPSLKQQLDAEGLDTRRDGFKVLAPHDLRTADFIVTFKPIPESLHWRELSDWSDVASVNDAWPTARADLMRRIDALLDRVEARKGARP